MSSGGLLSEDFFFQAFHMGKIAYYCGSDKVAAAVEQLFESFPVGRVDKKSILIIFRRNVFYLIFFIRIFAKVAKSKQAEQRAVYDQRGVKIFQQADGAGCIEAGYAALSHGLGPEGIVGTVMLGTVSGSINIRI